MKIRLLAGIFSLLLVVLVIVGPVYLSEKLEVIETSRSGLVSSSGVISTSGESSTSYSPYLEFNEDNKQPVFVDPISYNYGCFMRRNNLFYDMDVGSYNTNGYFDTFSSTVDLGTGSYLYYIMRCDFSEMYANDINQFHFEMHSQNGYWIQFIGFRGCDGIGTNWFGTGVLGVGTYIVADLPSEFAEYQGGNRTFQMNFTETDLLGGISASEGYAYGIMMIVFKLDEGYTPNNIISSNFQINPEYFEVTETTDNNSTRYEPYIQSISPYSVHKVTMGAGGILIFLVGLVASPLPIGNVFNGIFPINNQKRRRSR